VDFGVRDFVRNDLLEIAGQSIQNRGFRPDQFTEKWLVLLRLTIVYYIRRVKGFGAIRGHPPGWAGDAGRVMPRRWGTRTVSVSP
jgi:hypothetical protein